MRERALKTIEELKSQYNKDKFLFDLTVSMYISGPSNKELRREMYQILQTTNERPPLTKCGMFAISTLLKAKFEQFTLF